MTKKITKDKSKRKAEAQPAEDREKVVSTGRSDFPTFGLGGVYRLVDRWVSSELLAGSGICMTLLVSWLVFQKDMFAFSCTAVAGTLVWALLYIGLKKSK